MFIRFILFRVPWSSKQGLESSLSANTELQNDGYLSHISKIVTQRIIYFLLHLHKLHIAIIYKDTLQ